MRHRGCCAGCSGFMTGGGGERATSACLLEAYARRRARLVGVVAHARRRTGRAAGGAWLLGPRFARAALRFSVERARRATRPVRCAHWTRTLPTSQKGGALRMGPTGFALRGLALGAARRARARPARPAMLGCADARRRPPARPCAASGGVRRVACTRRGVAGGARWGRLWSGEQRRRGGGARSAHRELTRRGCSSAANAVSEASSAARPRAEQRSAVGAAGTHRSIEAPGGCPLPRRSAHLG